MNEIDLIAAVRAVVAEAKRHEYDMTARIPLETFKRLEQAVRELDEAERLSEWWEREGRAEGDRRLREILAAQVDRSA